MLSQAFWIDRQTIAIPPLFCKKSWRYLLANNGLERNNCGLTPEQAGKHPQLAGYGALRFQRELSADALGASIRSELVLTAWNRSKRAVYSTGVQIAGVLDEEFRYDGALGADFTPDGIEVRLWAPTSQRVDLLLFENEADETPAERINMHASGPVWTARAGLRWAGKYYLYSIRVYAPSVGQIVTNLVTDPYSADIGLNGAKTRFTDLRSPHTKPDGWDAHLAPPLRSNADLSIYELHLRDFSSADETLPPEHRGTYLAFTHSDSNGMRHLRSLADAGLKAVHLLPTFHFASVNEDKTRWKLPGDLSHFGPAAEEQQAAIAAIQNEDGYNWGYDPVHYMAPAGCYASNPANRVREYRAMVMALHQAGLRVIQDEVFNHTTSNGQAPNSVLDRIVPGYYYRLDLDGNVLNATCCPDTASEHFMMERLMVDCAVQNAREYKIDGFRFDLMGFHFVRNLQRMQGALAATGANIYLYGEGWAAAETETSAAGPNAVQANLYGAGIGSFNDRLRDGIRGGSPFTDAREQGFATGLFTAPNAYTARKQTLAEQRALLLQQSDWIRASLAGNLRHFRFQDCFGNVVLASSLTFNKQPAAYAAAPVETVNYCSVHDNQTLFDAVQLKAPIEEPIQTRVRRHVLAMSLVALGQGIPFFLGGDDLLRSKDMDHNSYDSGDWFNKIDFSYRSANWGVGLPIARENEKDWPVMRPLLEDPKLAPGKDEVLIARTAFQELLRIRASSPLFRMETLEQVQANLQFLNTGPKQIPGLIVMTLGNELLAFFNARPEGVQFVSAALKGRRWTLHPAQQNSFDPVVRTATLADGVAKVPGLTTAVFVSKRPPRARSES